MLPIQRMILIPKALMTAILMMKKQELSMMTASIQVKQRILPVMILLQRIPLSPAMILHLIAVHLILVHLTQSGTYLETLSLQLTVTVQPAGTAGNATASGTMPVAGRTVAMAGVPFGTKLLIRKRLYGRGSWNSV